MVDLASPAYKCSCPSRKFPCKHALGLLLLWSAGTVPDTDEPADFVQSWLDGRTTRAARSETKTASDPARAAKAAERRRERVSDGLEEFDRWLCDQLHNGLAGVDTSVYKWLDPVASRLVDAQAPGVAARVRELASVFRMPNWPDQLLRELSMLRLLIHAHRRLDELDPPLAATVRRHIGYPVTTEEVLAIPGVLDEWEVLGRNYTGSDKLVTRRTFLYGRATNRLATLMSFAPNSTGLDVGTPPGTAITATAHFYPGQPKQRVLLADGHPAPQPIGTPTATGRTIATAFDHRAAAIAQDPWLTQFPVIVTVLPALSNSREPTLVDEDGHSVRLHAADEWWWSLLAVSGGQPVHVLGDLADHGMCFVAAWSSEGLVHQ